MTASTDASLAARVVSGPVPRQDGPGRSALDELRQRSAGTGLDAVLSGAPAADRLLQGIADHSPYLWRLISIDPERAARLLSAPTETALAEALDAMVAACRAAVDPADVMRLLRQAKAEIALLVALADLGGVWELEPVVRALTDFADAAVREALAFLLRQAQRQGKLACAPAEAETAAGIVVLALGKGGGGELNYSSDIDLVVFYDPAVARLAPEAAPAPFSVRLTQALVRLLSDRTEHGYVLRVDLRLRPDPGSTAVAISLPAAFTYYTTLGQNWERAAYIKARPIAGDIGLGERFLADLAPFIWRKYFDYAAIADIHAMKRQIHAVRGFEAVAVAGHDVKLGRGGIREIEFFVQTQQLIFGGRRPKLRGPRTLDMLGALAAEDWITDEAAQELSQAYRFLRRIEHRLQMVADEQTQRLPASAETLAGFAAFAGYDTLAAFEAELLHHMRAVEAHYARLFEHAPGLDVSAGSLVFAGASIDAATVETLGRLGFVRPAEAVETVRGWHFGRRAAVQSARAREVLTELVPALLLAFSGSGDPDTALGRFDTLLSRMPAAIELFAILKQNAALRELFADILGLAPRLAATVAGRPHLLDAAIDPANFREDAGIGPRLERLDPRLPSEDFLDRARDIAQEEIFLVGVRMLSGAIDPEAAGPLYADLAAAIVERTLAHCRLKFEEEHGRVPGGRCVVIAMGKLGSREMTAGSDLDLLLIYDFDPEQPDSDGPRSLPATRYFARLTQRLIAALTVATRRGRLYEVDMRLRPSGGQGPVATQLRSFIRYQAEEAEIWEKMALTRARAVAGDRSLAGAVEAAIGLTLAEKRGEEIRPVIAGLRALVAREKGESNPWDLKLAAGGLLDIEFLAQFLVLRHAASAPSLLGRATADILSEAGRLNLLSRETAESLVGAHRLLTRVTQLLRLAIDGPFDPETSGPGLRRRLVAAADVPDFATLERDLRDRRQEVRAIFRSIIG